MDKIVRGTTEIIDAHALADRLNLVRREGRPLRVKAGFDPTAPDIHLGHAVLLRKLRQFQDLGHTVDFLVGDFTAVVGDPSGRNKLRPALDRAYVLANARTYMEQAFKILDPKKTQVVFNGDWLHKMPAASLLALTARSTVAQMLARNDFKQRFEVGREISLMEFVYPLLQGFDSYILRSDVELGGNDQRFNLLMGRQIQEALRDDTTFREVTRGILLQIDRQDEEGFFRRQNRNKPVLLRQDERPEEWIPAREPQVVLMMPLLEGLDGDQKMSKSAGNYIGVTEAPSEMFGKLMSISDALMERYFELLTDISTGAWSALHPKEAKALLAEDIVRQFHGADSARQARREFDKVFSRRQVPDDMPQWTIQPSQPLSVVEVLARSGLAPSKREARRLIAQGAVTHEGQRIDREDWLVREGVLKVGKRRFLKLVN